MFKIIKFLRGISVAGIFISLALIFESLFNLTTIPVLIGFVLAFLFFSLIIKHYEIEELKLRLTYCYNSMAGRSRENEDLIERLDEQHETTSIIQKEFKKVSSDKQKLEKELENLKRENESLKAQIASDALFIKKLNKAFNRFSKLYKYDSPKRHSASLGYMFSEIGWDKWKPSVHENQEQIDRYHRAKNEPIKLLSYDETEGKAIIKGTSGENYLVTKTNCSCPDFGNKNRHNGPCKHMYYLSMELYKRKNCQK